MNFASLLRMHENRQTNNYSGNQFMINCNRKNQNPIIFGAHNYSGIKKRPLQTMDMNNQRLIEIYSNFEQNPHVQWILQLQTQRVKIHKFKPSKIKTKKDEVQNMQKFQPRLYPQQKHQVNPPTQYFNDDRQKEPIQHEQFERQRKNYSPMHQVKPRNLNQEKAWMQNLNQNKFSFGDDAELISQPLSQRFQQDPQNLQNQCQIQNEPQIDDKINRGNQNFIEERQDYEVPETQQNQNQNPLILNNKFDNLSDAQRINYNNIQQNDPKTINTIPNIDQAKNTLQNPSQNGTQQTPASGIQFDPNVGFSFDQIDKICLNQQPKKDPNDFTLRTPNGQNPVEQKNTVTVNQTQTPNPIDENYKKITQTPSNLNIANQPKPNSLKSINIENTPYQDESKKVEATTTEVLTIKSDFNSRQSSPNRIYCKANVRHLTPEKFKYPRVDSKIKSNTDIQPFSTQGETNKNNTKQPNNLQVQNKVQNLQKEKVIIVPSSDRLLALIDESKRLLQSRNVGQEKKNEDRIKRIVLHQPSTQTKITLRQPEEIKKEQQKVEIDLKREIPQVNQQVKVAKQANEKLTVNTKNQVKQLDSKSTPQKMESNLPSVTSPRSPLQQKPKFFNQLANIETNYTPEKTNITTTYVRQTQNTSNTTNTINKVPPQFQSNQNTQPNPPSTNISKNTQILPQVTYTQSNYAYKPMNVPQQKPIQRNDTNSYKPTTVYQANISPYQPTTQIYQPTVTGYTQVSNQQQVVQKTISQTQFNTNLNNPQVKTYAPYFPITNTNNTVKPSSNAPVTQNKINQVYQTYTYSGFPSSQPQTIRPQSKNQNNNFIKINTNYVSPLDKNQQKEGYQIKVNPDIKQQETLKPFGLGIEGIKCVQSKVYDPKVIQSDPKQTSIEFSLRIEQHFYPGGK